MTTQHEQFMREAIEWSRKGYPAPNPHVGAVIVKNGEIVGIGFHGSAGGPHAEVLALEAAQKSARGADLYVTLEPCKHFGKTPPCVQAISDAGIARVFIACTDPNPVASGGAEILREHGIEVHTGLCEREAAAVNDRFLSCFELGRPHVTVKAAISLDGRLATKTGDSKWITDETARARAHELRAICGCVLVGARTVARDDPSLTVRSMEVGTQPMRVVLDGGGALTGTEKLFRDQSARTMWFVGRHREKPAGICADVNVLPVDEANRFDLRQVLSVLREASQTSVLIEGGGATIGSFLQAGLVELVELHVAPVVLGAGIAWAENAGVATVAEAWRVCDFECEALGNGLKLSGRIQS